MYTVRIRQKKLAVRGLRSYSCKLVNIPLSNSHPVPVKSPWYHIGIDFIGPIDPTLSHGNRHNNK